MRTSILLSCLFGFVELFVLATANDEKKPHHKLSKNRINPSINGRKQAAAADEFNFIRRKDGGIDLVLKSDSNGYKTDGEHEAILERSEEPHYIVKRSADPPEVCKQLSEPNCEYRVESARCIGGGLYQVYCAGCWSDGQTIVKHKDRQKTGKNACPNQTSCFNVNGINAWGEDHDTVTCVPFGQRTLWTVTGSSMGQDTKLCSPGVTNTSGRSAKIEAIVNSLDSSGQYEVNAKTLTIVLNAAAIDHMDDAADFATDLILRPKSSVQGCITTKGAFHQVLKGKFGIRFV